MLSVAAVVVWRAILRNSVARSWGVRLQTKVGAGVVGAGVVGEGVGSAGIDICSSLKRNKTSMSSGTKTLSWSLLYFLPWRRAVAPLPASNRRRATFLMSICTCYSLLGVRYIKVVWL